MLDREKVTNHFMDLKKVVYIEKDETGNIIYPKDKNILKKYKEILTTKIKDSENQYYHKETRAWYQMVKSDYIDTETGKTHHLEFLEDITSFKLEQIKLKIDALTKLMKDRNECNRQINEYIRYAINHLEEFALLVADIDDFKIINDTYGHDCGDFVLRKIGPALLKYTRQSGDQFDYHKNDIVCRLGGDEFLILLKNISLEDTRNKIIGLKDAIKNSNLVYNDQNINVGMSFGYYHVSTQDMEISSDIDYDTVRKKIFDLADKNLYRDKKTKVKRK